MNLKIENLTKKYSNDQIAVNNLNLEIENGVLGLLGPNGAGKSSLMRMLATVSKPTSGEILWNDMSILQNPNVIREILGYLPQYFGVYENLNAIEFLSYIAAIKGINPKYVHQRIDELLEFVNLTDVAKRPLGKYSGGMRQRIGIAQALLNDPDLLIVDEPTVGLDPEERVRFRDLVKDLAKDRIIIFSTHIVSDIETIATNVAIMRKGNLILHDSIANVTHNHSKSLEAIYLETTSS